MPIKKEIKYGYPLETTGKRQLAKPSNLTKILLTPRNPKFLFYGTKNDILKWISSHPELLVEYDPLNKDNLEQEFTPPSSPISQEFLSSPTPITPLSTSPTNLSFPTSITPLSTSPTSPTFPTSPTSPTFPTSPTSPTFPTCFSNSYNIVFDLFTAPIKTSSILSDDKVFNKPLNIASKLIPWLEVMLEIRPADEHKDSKLHPIHRVILPSGTSLSKISKALEKSWKSLLPDQTDCCSRNNELFNCQNKSKLVEESREPITKSINLDNEESLSNKNKFMTGIAKHVPSVDLWLRQKQTSGPIPPGVLTPYIIEDVLEDLCEDKRREEFVNPKILRDKKQEAEMDQELRRPDLPQYKTVFGDILLERSF